MFENQKNTSSQSAGNVSGLPHAVADSRLELEFAHLSDCGRVRDHNEDYLGDAPPANPAQARARGWLFVLADGVGGQDRGEVASRLAVETIVAGFTASAGAEPHTALLPKLVQDANHKIYEAGALKGGGRSDMATTVVACALRYDRIAVAHVGDSRCYLIRHNRANLLTRDHTLVNEQRKLGISRETEMSRHVLSRSVGNDLFVNVETSDHHLLEGDVLLLCSDGLHGAVPGSEMAALLSHGGDLNAAAKKLVMIANQRDGSDNVSVQLIRVLHVERVGMYRGRPYKLR